MQNQYRTINTKSHARHRSYSFSREENKAQATNTSNVSTNSHFDHNTHTQLQEKSESALEKGNISEALTYYSRSRTHIISYTLTFLKL